MASRLFEIDASLRLALVVYQKVAVELKMEAIPLLQGAEECSLAGVASSLLPSNAHVAAWTKGAESISQHFKWPLLLDPQTGQSHFKNHTQDSRYTAGEHNFLSMSTIAQMVRSHLLDVCKPYMWVFLPAFTSK